MDYNNSVYHVKTKQNISVSLTGPWPSACNATCVPKGHITSHTGILWSDVASFHLRVFVPFGLRLENENPADQSRVGCQGSQKTALKGHTPESSCLRSMSHPYRVLRGQRATPFPQFRSISKLSDGPANALGSTSGVSVTELKKMGFLPAGTSWWAAGSGGGR